VYPDLPRSTVVRMASDKGSATNMSSDEKQYDTLERVETLDAIPKRKGYRPRDSTQVKLDRMINLKLDCIVVILLSIDFLVSSPQSHLAYCALEAELIF
jgi:hypothetical protein